MVNLILLITIWNLLSYFINPRKDLLLCGLSGFNGKTPDPLKIRVLGQMNESRGKNSSGIAYKKQLRKGAGKQALFSDLVKNESFNFPNNCSILVHTRAATVGAHTEDNAHPFLIKNAGKRSLVFMHNGTLIQTRQLAEKFDLKSYNYAVDSLLLGNIVSLAGPEEAFAAYNGAAACAFYYTNEPEILYLWKGASSNFPESKVLLEERPLHFIQMGEEEGMYFSSEGDPLKYVSNLKKTIFEVEDNTLMSFQGGLVLSSVKINRDHCYQNEPIYPKQKEVEQRAMGFHSRASNDVSKISKSLTSEFEFWPNDTVHKGFQTHAVTVYSDHCGKFSHDGKLLNGICYHQFPVVNSFMTGTANTLATFFEGILLKDSESYKIVKELWEEYKDKKSLRSFVIWDGMVKYIHPDWMYARNGFYYIGADKPERFTGFYRYPGGIFIHEIEDGKHINSVLVNNLTTEAKRAILFKTVIVKDLKKTNLLEDFIDPQPGQDAFGEVLNLDFSVIKRPRLGETSLELSANTMIDLAAEDDPVEEKSIDVEIDSRIIPKAAIIAEESLVENIFSFGEIAQELGMSLDILELHAYYSEETVDEVNAAYKVVELYNSLGLSD